MKATSDLAQPGVHHPISEMLDAARVGSWLGDILPTSPSRSLEVQEIRVERYFPVRDRDFCVEWSFADFQGARRSVWGLYRSPSTTTLGSSEGTHGSHKTSILRSENVALLSFENDPALPWLRECLTGTAISDAVGSIAASTGESTSISPTVARCRLHGYRPHRRAVIECEIDGALNRWKHIALKMYRDDRGERIVALHAWLHGVLRRATDGGVTVATPLGYLPSIRCAAFVWNAGDPQDSRQKHEKHAPEFASRAAYALHTLHGVSPLGLQTFNEDSEMGVVKRWQRLLERADPTLAEQTEQMIRELNDYANQITSSHIGVIHRDFYGNQLLLNKNGLTLIDLDTLAQGDVCVDLGNFLAHEILQSLVHRGECGGAYRSVMATLETYEAPSSRLDRRTLGFYLTTSLFRLGAVHALRWSTNTQGRSLWLIAGAIIKRRQLDLSELHDLLQEAGSEVREHEVIP